MSGDKPQNPKDGTDKSHDAVKDVNQRTQITPADQAKALHAEKQRDAASHNELQQSSVLPKVELHEKGFFSNLVDGVSNAIAGAEKQRNEMLEGAKQNLDKLMKGAGVSDEARKQVNESVGQVVDVIKDPEKAAGQVLDQTEKAVDQGMKNAGVSDEVRKNVSGGIHTIRRIDEAELKFVKGVGEGVKKLVGGATHLVAGAAAETLDRAEEYKKTNPIAQLDVTGASTLGVAALETVGKAAGGALQAAEQFGEQLKKDSDKEGGLDKLVAKKAQETQKAAEKWVGETNLENLGQKAEQVGEITPDVALLAAGGLAGVKALKGAVEAANAMRKGTQVVETTEALSATGQAVESTTVKEGAALAQENVAGVADVAADAPKPAGLEQLNPNEHVSADKLAEMLKKAREEGQLAGAPEAVAETGEGQSFWRMGESESLTRVSQAELGVEGNFTDFQAAWGKNGDVVNVTIDNIRSDHNPNIISMMARIKDFARAHDGTSAVVKFVEGNPELRDVLYRRYKNYIEKSYDGYHTLRFPLSPKSP